MKISKGGNVTGEKNLKNQLFFRLPQNSCEMNLHMLATPITTLKAPALVTWHFPAGIYLFKVNNGNTKTMSEISKLKITFNKMANRISPHISPPTRK